jgi:hypothetical protein
VGEQGQGPTSARQLENWEKGRPRSERLRPSCPPPSGGSGGGEEEEGGLMVEASEPSGEDDSSHPVPVAVQGVTCFALGSTGTLCDADGRAIGHLSRLTGALVVDPALHPSSPFPGRDAGAATRTDPRTGVWSMPLRDVSIARLNSWGEDGGEGTGGDSQDASAAPEAAAEGVASGGAAVEESLLGRREDKKHGFSEQEERYSAEQSSSALPSLPSFSEPRSAKESWSAERGEDAEHDTSRSAASGSGDSGGGTELDTALSVPRDGLSDSASAEQSDSGEPGSGDSGPDAWSRSHRDGGNVGEGSSAGWDGGNVGEGSSAGWEGFVDDQGRPCAPPTDAERAGGPEDPVRTALLELNWRKAAEKVDRPFVATKVFGRGHELISRARHTADCKSHRVGTVRWRRVTRRGGGAGRGCPRAGGSTSGRTYQRSPRCTASRAGAGPRAATPTPSRRSARQASRHRRRWTLRRLLRAVEESCAPSQALSRARALGSLP